MTMTRKLVIYKQKMGGVIMNKEEILEKSKEENKNRDPYEMEVSNNGFAFGFVAAMIIGIILWAVELIATGILNFRIYCLAVTVISVSSLYRGVKLKNKKLTCIGILLLLLTLFFTYAALMQALGLRR